MAVPMTPEEIQAALLGPAAAPPNEETAPNLENPSHDNTTAYWVTGVALVLASIVVLVRVYSRAFRTKRVRPEDICGLLSYGFYIAHAWSIFSICSRVGFFVHQWDTRLQDFGVWLRTVSLLRTFYFLTIGFAKNAILLEWKTIFVPHPIRNAFYWTCWVLIIVNTLYYIAVITTTHLYCIPFDAAWKYWIEGHCINLYVADVIILSFNLFTDLVILILPQRIIWTLQMRTERRLGIAVIFSLGLITCACAAGRVQAVVAVDYNGDAEYGVDKVILWGVGELTGLLIVFCVPAAPKAFDGEHKWIHRLKQSLGSWSFSTKGLVSSTNTRLPPRESSSGIDVYERMPDSSQVELTHIQHDLKGRQVMTQ